jgi:hypothetical protein
VDIPSPSYVLLTFMLGTVIGLVILALWGWQTYLLLSGQTTIEYYQNQEHRAFASRNGQVCVFNSVMLALALTHCEIDISESI